MADKSRITYLEKQEKIDGQTGEVLEKQTAQILRLPKEPPFVKLYIQDVARLFEVPKGASNLLLELVKRMQYDGYFVLSVNIRKGINDVCKFRGEKTIDKYLKSLCLAGVMKHTGRNEYRFNPDIFAKGDWSDIYRMREEYRLVITYKNGKRKITGEPIKPDEPDEQPSLFELTE